MFKTKIIFLILSLFTTSIKNRVLFHETMTIDSLNLSEQELTDKIIKYYQIKTDYKNITIESDYFINPKFNQIYSVTLEADYDGNIIIYNLKIKAVNIDNTSINNRPIILIVSSLTAIVVIIYFSIRKQ